MLDLLLDAARQFVPERDTLIKTRQAVPDASDRLRGINQTVTPERVAAALDEAARGRLGVLQEIYKIMYASDAHYRACANSVQSALSALPLRISPGRSDSELAEAAAKMAEHVLSYLPMRRLMRSMALVHTNGVRVYANDYVLGPIPEGFSGGGATGGQWAYIAKKRLVAPTRYLMQMKRDEKGYGELALKTDDRKGYKLLADYPAGSLTWLTADEEDGWYDLSGVGRTCLFWYCVKHFNTRWWARLNEVYGQPRRVAYYEPHHQDETLDAIEDHLKQLSYAAWAMFPADTDVEVIEQQLSGSVKTYDDLIGLADNQMSEAIVGQIGTTGRDKYGSYGETAVLNRVRHEIVASVAGQAEESIRDDVRILCRLNIDPEFPEIDLPHTRVVVPNPEEKILKLELIEGARRFIRVPEQWAYDELGIPEPAAGESILPGYGEEGDLDGMRSRRKLREQGSVAEGGEGDAPKE